MTSSVNGSLSPTTSSTVESTTTIDSLPSSYHLNIFWVPEDSEHDIDSGIEDGRKEKTSSTGSDYLPRPLTRGWSWPSSRPRYTTRRHNRGVQCLPTKTGFGWNPLSKLTADCLETTRVKVWHGLLFLDTPYPFSGVHLSSLLSTLTTSPVFLPPRVVYL